MSSYFFMGFSSSVTNSNGNIQSNEMGIIREIKKTETIETKFNGPETLTKLKQRKPKVLQNF